jgi:2-polyprenyl-3-methyl-5-hydroxy-6-metoxy-1,4-benzoquinol methylase
MTKIASPLTRTNNVQEIDTIASEEIITIYSTYFKKDFASYFSGIREIKIMKCLETGYMFYYPFTTEGDEHYYAEMSKFDWYYDPSRWEHSKALELIKENEKVLEVGAGSGFFLKELSKRKNFVTGLELNGKAIEEAKKSGIELRKEFVQDFSIQNEGNYDTVCSFQVLEHIAQPYEFLLSKVKCLKKGGKMLIGVPNNNSFIKDNQLSSKVLNMPPHHMGLWTPESLESLESLFNISLKEIYYEPLTERNVDVYLWNRVTKIFLGFSIFTKILWKLKFHAVLRRLLLKKENKIKGNSMLAVFEKN